MKKTFLQTAVIILILSCNSETSDRSSTNKDTDNHIEISIIEESQDNRAYDTEDKFEFFSYIRPNENNLMQGIQYVDKLRFFEFNDDYDYSFSRFITETGDTVVLIHNDPIDNSNSGKLMKVLWEIGGFYEAGAGAELFHKESLVSYEIIKD